MASTKTTAITGCLLGMGIAASLIVGYGMDKKDFPEYHFNGSLGQEHVRFVERGWSDKSQLKVQGADGTTIVYTLMEDYENHTLSLKSIVITGEDGRTTLDAASKNAGIAAVVEGAKADVGEYLDAIVQEKVQQYQR